MAINYDALRKNNEAIKKFGGNDTFLAQKDLTDATPFRLAPDTPEMNGLNYFRVVQLWIDNVPYMDFQTFGKPSIFLEELDEAKNSDDNDIVALATDDERIKFSETFWYPGWQLEYVMDGNEISKIKVVDDCCKIFQAGPQMAGEINDIILSRRMMAIKSPLGIADRELGYNLVLSRIKKGAGKRNIKYSAQIDEPWTVPQRYFNDVVNPHSFAKAQIKTKDYQRAVIREYLYGEDIPHDVKKRQEELDAKRKEEYKALMAEKEAAAKRTTPKATTKKPAAQEEDEDEEEAEVPAKKVTKATTKKPVPQDDEDEDDAPFESEEEDAEEEETPVAKKSAAKKPAITDDIDMDEEEEEEEEAPKKPAPKKSAPAKSSAPATKAVAQKKTISSDFEDDFE